MDFQALVHSRRSVRGFRDEAVPKAVIREIIEDAKRAPSSMNSQPWHVHVLTGEPLIETVLDTVKFFGPRVVMRLKDADNRLSLADEIKIDGRPAVGVELSKVAPTFKLSLRLYFDKETNLLVRQDKLHETSSITYGDYKKFDGIQVAQKETKTVNGKVVTESEVIDFRVMDKLDDKLFEQP